MKKLIINVFMVIALSFVGVSFAKETTITPQERLHQQAEQAGQDAAANTVVPNEINSIKYRRILNGKAGLQMYVIFLSKSGQPIDYFVSDGKCTSSGKRLTPTHKLVDKGVNSVLIKLPSADGTYGSSAPYIYCKTADGGYKQWNGNYYAADAPIELTTKPIIFDIKGK